MRLFIVLLLAATLARANTTTGTDYTDLWWNPSGSGEGFTVLHEATTLFITFFTYGPNTVAPTWYVVTMTGSSPPYSGDLYATTCCAGTSTARAVGTATFAPSSASSATLTYTI